MADNQNDATFEEAALRTVDLGNQITQGDADNDIWDVADGLLAGAIQYWLYSREPCGDPRCEDCAAISTAELRLSELLRLTQQLAEDSEYFHSSSDCNVGHA
ncbi:MAG: hypothetical protein AB1810_05345 [Pseudomonadota bacterium]